MEKKQYIEAGKIINTHGVNGEVKIEVWLDSPQFLKKFKRLFIRGKEYKVQEYKTIKNFVIAKLEGVDDVNAAMTLKNVQIDVDRNDVKLPKDSYYICDIIGSKVVDENGSEIGVLTEVLENPAQPIYIVNGETEHLIPAVPDYIVSTDVENGLITVRLIEGM